jgi:hypothetical protein
MQFVERSVWYYLIYAGAMEARGGFVAAVVVNRTHGVRGAPREAFRDTAISGGHRWPSASDALAFAFKHAQAIISHEPQRLVC